MKKRKILGAKVRLLRDIKNCGGAWFYRGEIMEVYGSWMGLSLRAKDGRCITRVDIEDVEFID